MLLLTLDARDAIGRAEAKQAQCMRWDRGALLISSRVARLSSNWRAVAAPGGQLVAAGGSSSRCSWWDRD